MRLIKNIIEIYLNRIKLFFGVKLDDSIIPNGQYCYTPDYEKNKVRENFSTYYVKPCKYYKTLTKNYNGCSYLGIITDDFVFDDQCKMCDKNK